MKQALLLLVIALTLFACKSKTIPKNVSLWDCGEYNSDGSTAELLARPNELSIVGKWHAINMQYESGHARESMKQADVTAGILKQNRIQEFRDDDSVLVTYDGRAASGGIYERNGKKITAFGTAGNGPEDFEIVSLTEKDMTLRSTKERVTITMHKMVRR